jgi:hypothetical protein
MRRVPVADDGLVGQSRDRDLDARTVAASLSHFEFWLAFLLGILGWPWLVSAIATSQRLL